jgi:hypothetical protein
MRNILKNSSFELLMEIHPPKLKEYGSSVREIFTILFSNDFKVSEIIGMRRKTGSSSLRGLDLSSNIKTNQSMLYCYK